MLLKIILVVDRLVFELEMRYMLSAGICIAVPGSQLIFTKTIRRVALLHKSVQF
jgi:hypothetical protein